MARRRRLAIDNVSNEYRAKVGPQASQSQYVGARQGAGDFEASAQLGSAQQQGGSGQFGAQSSQYRAQVGPQAQQQSRLAGSSAIQSGGLQQAQQAQQQAQGFSSQQSEAAGLQQQADEAASQFQQAAQRVGQQSRLS